MAELPAGLSSWAAAPGPAAVLGAIRRRAHRGAGIERGVLVVSLDPIERSQVARVLGSPWDVSGRPVRLQDLAAALAEHGLTVRELVERVDGRPLADGREQRSDAARRSDAERARAAGLLADAGVAPEIAHRWVRDPAQPAAADGELVDLAERVVAVLARLPADPPVRLAVLATATGASRNAHALDWSADLGRAVARLLAEVHDLPRPDRPGRTWRSIWSAAGVLCDEVSSRVLVLNLPLTGDGPAARWTAAAPGEPLWLSRRSLHGLTVVAPRRVFVCENPTVLEAAADALGARCPPLVCTDGNPSHAVLDLVADLAGAGCGIWVRADLDRAGLGIVDQVRATAPDAVTWRFDTVTYLDHLAGPAAMDGDRSSVLRDLYAAHRVDVHEESLLDLLLADLSDAAAAS